MFIPAQEREKHGLPEGACCCKSPLCRRWFNMADPPKPPGRKRKATEEPVATATGRPVESSRAKPAVVVTIHGIKDAR